MEAVRFSGYMASDPRKIVPVILTAARISNASKSNIF
jgi:hypothetical protein